MKESHIAILGIPIENLNLAEVVDRIIEIVILSKGKDNRNLFEISETPANNTESLGSGGSPESLGSAGSTKSPKSPKSLGSPTSPSSPTPSHDHPQPHRATHYIGTANTQYIDNLHGLSWTHPKNPELLNILQQSTLITADGAPLVWLSRWLNNPLKERVAGSDLVPVLCKKISEKGLSVYFLGGEHDQVQKAVTTLKKQYPSLEIVGSSSPHIYIKGEHLAESSQRDQLILEDLSKASPDILFLSLGHPKQEIWFERIKNKIDIPVTIGIGGTLNFISNKVPRAPVWMQNWGLEWLHRIAQEPQRLIGRYFGISIKLFYLLPPLVLFHRLNGLITDLVPKTYPEHVQRNLLFISPHQTLAIVRMPVIINRHNIKEIHDNIVESFSQDGVIFDFSATRHLDLEGLALFVRVMSKHKNILTFGVSLQLKAFFHLHRIWPLFSHTICQTAADALVRLRRNHSMPIVFESIHQLGDTVVLNFFGTIDHHFNFDDYMIKYQPMWHNKNCIIDLTYCSFIDNAGLGFLLELHSLIKREGSSLKVEGLSRELKRAFKQANVERVIPVIDRKVLDY